MSGRRLAGRVAIVSGAAGGIGQAVARLFVQEGAGVLLADLLADECERLAADLGGEGHPGHAIATGLDVTEAQDWQRVVRLARRRFGYPNVLVNAAGVSSAHGLEGATEEEWSRVVGVCQKGTWLGMQACLRPMQLGEGGAIVNVASVLGLVGSSAAFAYHAAKGAVRSMTAAAAVETAGQGIRVNAVYPGVVRTPMTERLPSGFVDGLVDATPMRRAAEPDEVARAVLFLASDEASYITGAELTVDGGYTAR